jgi:hypothetical protein
MDIQETNDTALVNETITTDTSPVYSPTEDLVTVVTSSQSSTLPGEYLINYSFNTPT